MEPLVIKDIHLFWQLMEGDDARGDGWMAQLLGVDILTLREMHNAYLEREGSAGAARQRAAIALMSPEAQARLKVTFAHLYEGREG